MGRPPRLVEHRRWQVHARFELAADRPAERAVGVEHLTRQELVRGRVVRELLLLLREEPQIDGSALPERRAGEVDRTVLPVRIVEAADDDRRRRQTVGAAGGAARIEVDLDAELGAGDGHGAPDVGQARVAAGVDRDDVGAPPAEQLGEAEVLPVPAVGDVDVPAVRVREPEAFLEYVPRAGLAPATHDVAPDAEHRLVPAGELGLEVLVGVADPDAQPDVHHRHQEPERRQGEPSHHR
jgi:hypothetical protein